MSRNRTPTRAALAGAILFALVTALPAHRRLQGLARSPTDSKIGTIIINEVDSDQVSTDTAEFVELFDGGLGNTPLDGYVVVFYNGSDDLSYAAFDLDGFATNATGFFTLGNSAVPGVDLVFTNGRLQNGPDAVALFGASATDFPTGTAITTTNIVDALVYSNATTVDTGLLVLLNVGQLQINENSAGTGTTVSMQRIPNGLGGERNTDTYQVHVPTPDGPNQSPTVAPLSLSGRVIDAFGNGLRGATITIESGTVPESRSALTSSFGYYSFEGLTTGTYMVTVTAKRHTFAVPARSVNMIENVTNFDFVAEPQE